MVKRIQSSKTSLAVIVLSILTAVALGAAVWDINFWPSDEYVYYFPAAQELSQLKYLSEIHHAVDTTQVRWLHGKEIFILFINWMQRLMHDFDTVRPLVMVCLAAVALSSILVYFVTRYLWGRGVGLICYFLFAASLWPYLYVLFAKHQPLGLMFFLLAVYLLQFCRHRQIGVLLSFLSGLSVGLAVFSSTVASLYLPYYCAAYAFTIRKEFGWKSSGEYLLNFLKCGGLVVLGITLVFVYVNAPNIAYNIKSYIEYVRISGTHNHFYYNQPFLKQWFPSMVVETARGGWVWVFKYFLVIMPVLLPLYLGTIGCLLVAAVRPGTSGRWRGLILLMIVLSFAAVGMAEIAQVAQYGANYFPAMVGIIMLIGFAAYFFQEQGWVKKKRLGLRVTAYVFLAAAGLAHLFSNAYLFLTDVYPCRMVTTFLSRTIEKVPPKNLYTYMIHPHRNQFVLFLNPDLLRKVKFIPVEYIVEPRGGDMMVPPFTGNSIYIASISKYTDFDGDIFFYELLRTGRLKDYALASFKTLANSRIWIHEEEILSYRELILGHDIPARNELTGRVWLLDEDKVHRDKAKIIPAWEYLDMFQRGIRQIGKKDTFYGYGGFTGRMEKPKVLHTLLTRIYKVGNPTDSLVAYVYKADDEELVYVPHGKNFVSKPLAAQAISYDDKEGLAAFEFDPPLELSAGSYDFVIYRTGPLDDNNFYRIYKDYLGIL